MESQPGNDQPQIGEERFLLEKAIYYGLLGLGLFALLGFLLFGTVSTDLDCVRSAVGLVECSLVHNTFLQNMNPIKIHNVLAVDVIEHQGKTVSYSAEIRAENLAFTLPIASSYNYKIAQNAADEVNAFLHSSSTNSFTTRFPRKRLQ